jgi:peptide/nickel transport system permease protein
VSAAPEVILSSETKLSSSLSEPGFTRRLVQRPLAVAALGFLAVVILAAILAPLVSPYDPNGIDLTNVLSGPTWEHPLGTDDLGRDVLSRLIYGGRVTLLGAALGVAVALVVGVSGGLAAGYRGGSLDRIVTRLADMALAIPAIMLLLVVLSVFGRNEAVAMIAFGLVVSPSVMRIVRSATLAVRNEQFVDAARVLGLPHRQIVSRHILPRVSGTIIVQASLLAAGAVLTEAGLGFLGLGVPPPTATWGGLVQTASTLVEVQPWLLVPTGLVVALTVLAFGLLGDAVRDASVQSWQQPATRPRRLPSVAGPVTSPTCAREGAGEFPVLSVVDLVVEFPGPVRVVDGVSFDVNPGETLGLVGETGCGKTTTALAIIGLLSGGGQIDRGHCWFDGEDLARLDVAALRRIRGSEIALVSQNATAGLDPVFTVGSQLAEVVRLYGRALSRAAVQSRVLELLTMVELSAAADVARRYPHELSGGMAQRVAIAAALAGRPRLLIADEPTTALDVTLQAGILDLLRSLQQGTGMAILLITHDWGVVADACERAIMMYAGQIVEDAAVEELFRRPLHPYTEGLLESNPHLGRPLQRLAAIPGAIPGPGNWPSGCRFHPRCKYATTQCRHRPIALVEEQSGRLVRCIHSDELRVREAVR